MRDGDAGPAGAHKSAPFHKRAVTNEVRNSRLVGLRKLQVFAWDKVDPNAVAIRIFCAG
jgi:hypothetical protein